MSIILTEKAADEIKRVLQDQQFDENSMLRVSVVGGGCSGFSYSLNFDTEYDAKVDIKREHYGVSVLIDKKSDLYLDGTTLDFHDELDQRGFKFDNPNAVKSCGCGSSFQA